MSEQDKLLTLIDRIERDIEYNKSEIKVYEDNDETQRAKRYDDEYYGYCTGRVEAGERWLEPLKLLV